MIDYWFDFIKSMRKFMDINHYLLLFLRANGWKGRIPSSRFWGITFLYLQFLEYRGIKLIINGDILTLKACFKEMEDYYIKEKQFKYNKEFMEGLIR